MLELAAQALLSAIDPESGQQIVTRVFRSDEMAGLGIGGDAGGDLYMDFAHGYAPSRAQNPMVFPIPARRGAHGYFPFRAEMQTIWFIAGGGILPAQELSGIRLIDVAPTLASLTGIPAPADSRGHIVGQLKTSTAQ